MTYDSSSYVSSTATAATKIFSLKNKLKKEPTSIIDCKDECEYGENDYFDCSRNVNNTDEIKKDEIFMPQTIHSREYHESKLKWEKENRDLFHIIKDIDTGIKIIKFWEI